MPSHESLNWIEDESKFLDIRRRKEDVRRAKFIGVPVEFGLPDLARNKYSWGQLRNDTNERLLTIPANNSIYVYITVLCTFEENLFRETF